MSNKLNKSVQSRPKHNLFEWLFSYFYYDAQWCQTVSD